MPPPPRPAGTGWTRRPRRVRVQASRGRRRRGRRCTGGRCAAIPTRRRRAGGRIPALSLSGVHVAPVAETGSLWDAEHCSHAARGARSRALGAHLWRTGTKRAESPSRSSSSAAASSDATSAATRPPVSCGECVQMLFYLHLQIPGARVQGLGARQCCVRISGPRRTAAAAPWMDLNAPSTPVGAVSTRLRSAARTTAGGGPPRAAARPRRIALVRAGVMTAFSRGGLRGLGLL